MTRDQIITRLLQLPGEIRATEELLFASNLALLNAKTALEDTEAEVLTNPEVSLGRNAEERKARLWLTTAEQRQAIEKAQLQVNAQAITLRHQQNELAALRSVVRLVVVTEGGLP